MRLRATGKVEGGGREGEGGGSPESALRENAPACYGRGGAPREGGGDLRGLPGKTRLRAVEGRGSLKGEAGARPRERQGECACVLRERRGVPGGGEGGRRGRACVVRGGAGPRRLASRGAPCLRSRGDLACSVFSCFPPPSALPGSLGVQLGNTLSYYPTQQDVRLIPAVHLSVSGEDTSSLSRQTPDKRSRK